jgi:hypothetical protein
VPEVPSSVPCVHCEYDLKGVAVMGPCPECGRPVRQSVPCCPRCRRGGDIHALTRHAHPPSWRCDACSGVGFLRGELRQALDGRATDLELASPRLFVADIALDGQVLGCGGCENACDKVWIDKSFTVDRCNGCGFVWLDRDEFEPLRLYIARLRLGGGVPTNIEAILGNREAIIASRSAGEQTGRNDAPWILAEIVLRMFLCGPD